MEELRQFRRIAVSGHGSLTQGDHNWDVELVDISLQGLRLNIAVNSLSEGIKNSPMTVTLSVNEDAVPISAAIQVTHILPSDDTPSPTISIGCKLISISVDDIAMLRRLIMFNAGDDAISDAELSILLDAIYDNASSASLS